MKIIILMSSLLFLISARFVDSRSIEKPVIITDPVERETGGTEGTVGIINPADGLGAGGGLREPLSEAGISEAGIGGTVDQAEEVPIIIIDPTEEGPAIIIKPTRAREYHETFYDGVSGVININTEEDIIISRIPRRWLSDNMPGAGEGIASAQLRGSEKADIIKEKKGQIEEDVSSRLNELTNRRQEMLQNMEERKVQLQTERMNRVSGLLSNMLTRFLNALDRIADISDRLENRIATLADAEIDVVDALAALDYANGLLVGNMTQIEAIRLELSEAIQGEITIEYIRELISDLRDNILETREAFRAVISAINN